MKCTVLFNSLKALRIGDVLVMLLSIVLLIFLYASLWQRAPATRVQVILADKVLGIYSLNQTRDVHVYGHLGEAVIHIADGRARIVKSPCTNQYCVHQGWLNRAGQAAVCLPNQMTLQLLGQHQPFDSLSY